MLIYFTQEYKIMQKLHR